MIDLQSPARPPRFLDRVRQALRARHLSRRTERAYVAWIRRVIWFHGKRHRHRWRPRLPRGPAATQGPCAPCHRSAAVTDRRQAPYLARENPAILLLENNLLARQCTNERSRSEPSRRAPYERESGAAP